MDRPFTFAQRLQMLIDERAINKSELARVAEVNKANITRYLKGEYEAKQDVVYRIASRLHVNAAWLMGYDVSMSEDGDASDPEMVGRLRAFAEQAAEEQELVRCWRLATVEQRQTIAFILRDYGMPFPKAEPVDQSSLSSGA